MVIMVFMATTLISIMLKNTYMNPMITKKISLIITIILITGSLSPGMHMETQNLLGLTNLNMFPLTQLKNL